jgi:23S rRNA (cytosine1962-C5)-methyltransferase
MIHLQSPSGFRDYELLDCGNGEKLERFGAYILRRPEPQAVWKRGQAESEWQAQAHATFAQEGSHGGKWVKHKDMPDNWFISYTYKGMKLKFRLALTAFKHVGVFPEQSVNWDFIYDTVTAQQKKGLSPKVLNLFAYTGGASLAARSAGADTIHCDSVRQVVNWASSNMEASNLRDIRWLVEDAFKFVQREARRGNQYQGIIMDPPAYGIGPKGEKWQLEDMIDELIAEVAQILDPKHGFLVFNSYSLGFSSLVLENLVSAHWGAKGLKAATLGELFHPDRQQHRLPMGIFVRLAL